MKSILFTLPAIALGGNVSGWPWEHTFSEQGGKYGVATGGHSFAVAMADVDNDGYVDMFVTNSESSNRLYLNNWNGGFGDATSTIKNSRANLGDPRTSRGAIFGDVNGDGNLDLYVTDSSGANNLYIGDGEGGFVNATTEAGVGGNGMGQAACFADVDSDGDLDIFVANFGQADVLYLNNGKGEFLRQTFPGSEGINGFGCAFGDVNEDGKLDLYVTNAGSYNKLYMNLGDGKFTDITEESGTKADEGQGRGVSFADFDGDGHLDLFMVSPMTTNRMFVGDGTGRFKEVTESAGVGDSGAAQGCNVADIDGDGDIDIFVSNILSSSTMYRNNGRGVFTDISSEAGADYHLFGQGVAFGDVDDDGDLDMYVATWGTPPAGWPSQRNKLLINNAKVEQWLRVRPVTEAGHASLLGAEVRLFVAGTRTQVGVRMQIDGGSGFASQNAYDAYFGLVGWTVAGDWKFDIEVRCGGEWISKDSNPQLAAVSTNQVKIVVCNKAKNVVV